ncbi:glycosyl hydrolase family 28-related protein [Micromonospora sp. NPDC050695]|uniref:glycosyl hydrolase family 28-related protein n=1 Tax=Micromonospora sp. NPDC050695 TaxID=3154938 RepID=UPI00340BF595
MARLLGPDAGSRYGYRENGAPAANATAVVYADSAGTVLADIHAFDGSETPSGAVLGSQVAYDAWGQSELYWFPDGLVDRVWVSVDGGPVFPVDADNNRRLDAITVTQSGLFNVRAFGAVGDGTADDTGAFLAATAAAEAAQRAVLVIPPGTYKLTAPWSVNSRRVSIVGAGPQATTIVPTGLTAGQYALTLGWDNNVETGLKPEPYDAIRGVGFLGPGGAGQASCLRLYNASANGRAHSLTFRDVGIKGFDVQVDITSNSYLLGFDRCFFVNPQTYGVKMGLATTAGENVAFTSCIFADGPGIAVFIDQPGASFYFDSCSFDYHAQSLHQRAGQVFMSHCHFEATTTYGGSGAELLLLDRRGSVDRPVLVLSDCDFYNAWDNYDTCIRLLGDNGDQALRVANPSIRVTGTQATYFIRDDGPFPSDIQVSGAWYSRSDLAPPRLRNQAGLEWPITAGQRYTHIGPARQVRRSSASAIEPIPMWGARGSEALTSGRIYLTLFQPQEEITVSKVAFYTGGTAASGLTLAKVALYEYASAQLTLRAQSASNTALAAATNTRYEQALTSPYRCVADPTGKVYALAVLFIGTTMPALVTAGNNNAALMRDATYGHPAGLMVSGQTDMATPIFPGSWVAPDRLCYLLGVM